MQNSPPGSAVLALHAQVEDMLKSGFEEAEAGDKSLLQSWCMRGSPFFFPTTDAPVFTTGVLPPTERSMRRFLLGVGRSADKRRLSITETVDLVGVEILRRVERTSALHR